MSAAPAKKKTATKPKKAAAAKPVTKKSPAKKTAVTKPAPTTPAAVAPRKATAAPSAGPVEVCPSCGTTTFGPEERTRWEGRRTVRSTVLVCERGHTFAHPVVRPA